MTKLSIKNTKTCFLFLIAIVLTVYLPSCSSTHTVKSKSKYSTLNKRSAKNDRKTSGYAVTTKKTTNKRISRAETVNINKKSSARTNVSNDRVSIVEFALQHNGAKYRSGGKSPESGFDCSGFTNYVFNTKGIQINGPSHELAKMGREKPMSQLVPGDLAFFGTNNRISHVAIVADNRDNQIFVVHSTTSAGVKVDNISKSDYWSNIFLFGKDILSEK